MLSKTRSCLLKHGQKRDNCGPQFFERGEYTNDRCVMYQMILFDCIVILYCNVNCV